MSQPCSSRVSLQILGLRELAGIDVENEQVLIRVGFYEDMEKLRSLLLNWQKCQRRSARGTTMRLPTCRVLISRML